MASLTLNLAKCEFGKAVVTYLGKQVYTQVRGIVFSFVVGLIIGMEKGFVCYFGLVFYTICE